MWTQTRQKFTCSVRLRICKRQDAPTTLQTPRHNLSHEGGKAQRSRETQRYTVQQKHAYLVATYSVYLSRKAWCPGQVQEDIVGGMSCVDSMRSGSVLQQEGKICVIVTWSRYFFRILAKVWLVPNFWFDFVIRTTAKPQSPSGEFRLLLHLPS